MNENKLSEAGKQIAERLARIRERVDASTVAFDINPKVLLGEEFIKILENIPLGEPLIIDQQFNFAYIKDHTFHRHSYYQYMIRNAPNKCFLKGRKVHFYRCTTLSNMERINRSDRYCNTIALPNNNCEIDLRDKNDVLARLAWCQHCLEILLRDGVIIRPRQKNTFKSLIEQSATGGDWKKIRDCFKDYNYDHKVKIEKIKEFFQPFI